MITREYQVSGMCCGQCEITVLDEVAHVAGVEVAEVSARTGRLTVTSSNPVDTLSVLDAIDEAGFTALLVS
ncbi:heavy metal transporter [Mycobacterium asiaticum]|uniref:Heavy metal transporter n=1 Tax=Mycobacterium asiaticum TaxID=1790 RepID=A0A1A3NLV0_MYCAS|nr:heavy metal-associated domain-containing protein [Mycobacterium asiaticum]OBK21312.1 heavy metal transporter [Mycobacterium asiaticum]